jgi:hypothetical protein
MYGAERSISGPSSDGWRTCGNGGAFAEKMWQNVLRIPKPPVPGADIRWEDDVVVVVVVRWGWYLTEDWGRESLIEARMQIESPVAVMASLHKI